MENKYYLHRIYHEWCASKALFDLGYLTTGWSALKNAPVFNAEGMADWGNFDSAFNEKYGKSRGKNGLFRFLSLKEGDVVVVPLYDKEFAVVKIPAGSKVHSITDLPADTAVKAGLTETTDIGFYISFEKLNQIPRSYADKELISRMKVRQTNVALDDLKDAVDSAINRDRPINLKEKIQNELSKGMLECIHILSDNNMENLVKWYMNKVGATISEILPKNGPDKVEYEDADVKAVFEDLNLVFYIQVKNYEGETSSWAVEQIAKFKEMRSESFQDEISYVFWVISAADHYSDEAIEMAKENAIRLIDGPTFARMLLNVGIENINEDLQF